MTSKQRFLRALENKKADRLPVTTHHIMDYYLNNYEGGITKEEFFSKYNMDPIDWVLTSAPTEKQYFSNISETGYDGIVADDWQITAENIPNDTYKTVKYTITTPSGNLTSVIKSNSYTEWVAEVLVKEKTDIDIIAKHCPHYICDIAAIQERANRMGENGLIRSHVPSFDIMGQPGCWQDASVLFGIERLILETFDDPFWVKEFLRILKEKKKHYIQSMKGAPVDLIELGGGDASTTVISPMIFNTFAAPFDAEIIEEAHKNNLRTVYHTCGGMMPILEDIADMKTDAMETFTPPGMGGDVDLADAHERIGNRVCFIGGFDQGEFFFRSTEQETREAVRKCFQACGKDGGYILAPSDHFFDAKPELIRAFAEEALECTYN